MRVAIPGKMQNFTSLKPGDFFLYFSDGVQHWGMLTGAGASGRDETAPISFSEPVQKGLPTPCVHGREGFENRSVLVIDGAEVRAAWPLTSKDGSPKTSEGIGSLIIAEKSTMVRVKGSNNCWNIDIANGLAQRERAHPGSITVPTWEIGFVQDGHFKQILQFPKSTVQR